MNMNIRTKEVLTLQLTEIEVEALKIADKILLQVQSLLERLNKDDMMSPSTGEIIDYKGLVRAMDIISKVAENVVWEFEEID